MIVNGQDVSLTELHAETLLQLINAYELTPESVAVEMNGQIPDRSSWNSIRLRESDRIELVRFVGGG